MTEQKKDWSWKEFFREVHQLHANGTDFVDTEDLYQAFKARLVEELGLDKPAAKSITQLQTEQFCFDCARRLGGQCQRCYEEALRR